jgi:malonate transporter and related proteins
LSGCYPNTGYIGFPLAFLAYGPPSAPGATIAAVLTTCVLFGLAIALLEWDLHRGHALAVTVAKVGKSLIRDPIVVAPILASTITDLYKRDVEVTSTTIMVSTILSALTLSLCLALLPRLL